MREHLVQALSRRHTNDRRVHYLDKWCSLKISKGVSTHDTLKYCLDIIDNKSSMVKAVSRRRTHCRRVHYRDQWCSLKMSDTINCIFTHDTSSYYLGIIDNRSSLVQIVSRRHTHDQRVHYLNQWCSLKVSNRMSQRVSTTMLYQLVSYVELTKSQHRFRQYPGVIYDRRAHFLNQWCSLKVSNKKSQRESSWYIN